MSTSVADAIVEELTTLTSSVLEWRVVTDKSFVGSAIRFVTRGKVSHVEFMLSNDYTIGARAKGGVECRKADYAKFSLDIRFFVRCTPEQYQSAMDFLREQIGKPYDFTSIFGLLFNRNWRKPDHWFCSELWAAALEHAGLIGRLDDKVYRFTPQDSLLVSSAMFRHGQRLVA